VKVRMPACAEPALAMFDRCAIFGGWHAGRKHRDLAGKVAKLIQEMEASGELARLRERLVKQAPSESRP